MNTPDTELNSFEIITRLETERNEARKQRDELLAALEELSGLCERSWGTAIVGKPIRNQAKQAIANVKGENQ